VWSVRHLTDLGDPGRYCMEQRERKRGVRERESRE
jgi:hypothetical protein